MAAKKGMTRGSKPKKQPAGSQFRNGRSNMQVVDDMTSGGVERRAANWKRKS